MKSLAVALLVSATLSACGGSGAGSAAPSPTKTVTNAAPAVAGTAEPKEYKTPAPSGSPDDYVGY